MGDSQRPGWFPEAVLEQADTSFLLDGPLSWGRVPAVSLPVSLPPEAESEFIREEGVVGRGRGRPHCGAGGWGLSLVSLPGPGQTSWTSWAHLGPGSEEVGGGDGRGQVELCGRGGGEQGSRGRGVEGTHGEPQLVRVGVAATYQRAQAVWKESQSVSQSE